MKKIVSKAALGLLVGGAVLSAFAGGPDVPPAPMVTPGFYLGLGGSWNTVDVDFDVTAHEYGATTATTGGGVGSTNRLAPVGQVGYWAPVDNVWLWGLQATYKFLDAQFFSAGALGPNVNLFTYARVEHELLLLAYMGMQFHHGYAYLGVGPAMFTSYVRGIDSGFTAPQVHTQDETIWGGAAQLGYNWYFKPDWFLGMSYTYAVTGDETFSYTDGNTNTTVSQTYSVTAQEFVVTLNKVFAM